MTDYSGCSHDGPIACADMSGVMDRTEHSFDAQKRLAKKASCSKDSKDILFYEVFKIWVAAEGKKLFG